MEPKLDMINYMTCYKGSVEAWEIDHMGHMNVQFYLKKANQALKLFFLKNDINPNNDLSFDELFILEQSHLRYLAEQKAGSPLFIDVGINSLSNNSFTLTMVMKELLSKEPSASFSLNFRIIEKKNKNIQNLLQRAYEKYPFPTPEYGKPKGLKLTKKKKLIPSIKLAIELGMQETFLGIASSSEVDDDKCMGFGNYMSIISNAVPNILSESLSKADTNRFGGAALEYSFNYESFARIGTPLTIRSGLVDLGKKTFTWRHWIFNAKSGILLAEAEALVITLDLISRKSAAMPKEMFGSLEAILIDLN